MLASLHTLELEHAEWQRQIRTGLRQHQAEIADLNAKTRLFRAFESTFIPGLLQAAEYARARFSKRIAALIPAPLPRARPPRPPLPHLPAPRTGPDQTEAHLDGGRLDPSGRVSDRGLLHRLGWPPGRRIQFDIAPGAITATSTPTAGHTIGATGLLAIPAPVRQLCNLAAVAMVVLLADPAHDLLVVYPAQTVARLLADRRVAGNAG
ncbi:Scr1 family TA system antitoxin-like transcriptional regulator [Dactylosporangium siamense]|uniref:Uncharacterized protein n=1 Tax=Dactylosporangium siamense TaxID=685454 RepID=A0A919UF89_9ACTN|nr:Scr1 family TA system antitoxin-like transcriptional regulator [Dactylosporangium siamense]GIG49901.1 hypothetical protein Dsi01nite_079420 [Dactylosporangium siamense]